MSVRDVEGGGRGIDLFSLIPPPPQFKYNPLGGEELLFTHEEK